MPFDIKTARPISGNNAKSGFDISTARPIRDNNIPSEVLNKDSGVPEEYGIFGPMARGVQAVSKGASLKDVPGVVAQAASGFFGDTPERIANRPKAFSRAGLFGVVPGVPEENYKMPYPRPITAEGKKLGNELEGISGAAALSSLATDAPHIIKNARTFIDYIRKVDPNELYGKAEDVLIQILKPKIGEMNSASAKGLDAPESLKNSLPFIKPSKDYKELAKGLREAKIKSAKSRNSILKSNNFQLDDDFLSPLKAHIKDLSRRPQTEDVRAELEKAVGVYEDYKKWSEGGVSRVKGQIEKTRLQRETEPLLKKVAKGEVIDRSPDIVKAKDRVRSGLMRSVEGGNEEIKRLNQAYKSLNETSRMAFNQANLAKKAPKPNFLERTPIIKQAFQSLARNKPYSIQMATEALNQEPSLMNQTKKIVSLYERARALEEMKAASLKTTGFESSGRAALPEKGIKGYIGLTKNDEGNYLSSTSPKLLAGEKAKKLIGVDPSYGEGFERVPKEESLKRIKDFAFKYLDLNKKPDIEIVNYPQRRQGRFGIKTYKDVFESKAKTAYQAAKKRFGGG